MPIFYNLLLESEDVFQPPRQPNSLVRTFYTIFTSSRSIRALRPFLAPINLPTPRRARATCFDSSSFIVHHSNPTLDPRGWRTAARTNEFSFFPTVFSRLFHRPLRSSSQLLPVSMDRRFFLFSPVSLFFFSLSVLLTVAGLDRSLKLFRQTPSSVVILVAGRVREASGVEVGVKSKEPAGSGRGGFPEGRFEVRRRHLAREMQKKNTYKQESYKGETNERINRTTLPLVNYFITNVPLVAIKLNGGGMK